MGRDFSDIYYEFMTLTIHAHCIGNKFKNIVQHTPYNRMTIF